MEQSIKQHLQSIEQLYNIDILYACEAGSRAYGLHTEQSDYDVRFIFKYDVNEYLKLQAPQDVINDHSLPGADIQGWDIYKAMHLFMKSNPSLYEWLHSPIVYEEKKAFAPPLRKYMYCQYELKKLGFHYWSLIKANLKKPFSQPASMAYIKICLHVMRAYLSLQFMQKHHALPPLLFKELAAKDILPEEVAESTMLLYDAKKYNGTVSEEICLSIMNFVKQEMPSLKACLEQLEEGTTDKEEINEWIISLHKT